jgi:hypothetical protein
MSESKIEIRLTNENGVQFLKAAIFKAGKGNSMSESKVEIRLTNENGVQFLKAAIFKAGKGTS